MSDLFSPIYYTVSLYYFVTFPTDNALTHSGKYAQFNYFIVYQKDFGNSVSTTSLRNVKVSVGDIIAYKDWVS
jgi:hypothetical protein